MTMMSRTRSLSFDESIHNTSPLMRGLWFIAQTSNMYIKNLNQFDKRETLVVISTYPFSEDPGVYSAMDRYGQKKIQDIAKMRPVVLCAQYDGDVSEMRVSPHMVLARVWKKGDIMSLFRMIRFVLGFRNAPSVLIEFEFSVFGGTLANIALLFALALLRIRGKRVVFELHQVVTDIAKLKEHLHMQSRLMQVAYSIGIRGYYVALGIVCSHIIVLEQELKVRLQSYVLPSKISVLPHHMDLHHVIPQDKARAEIGMDKSPFVALVFGYINHYKGIDWIVRASKQWKDTAMRLLVAGGPNPYHIQKPYYQKYYRDLLHSIRKNSNIIHTDFVPDEKIGLYFSAADLIVLPYRVFMAASGPFSIALSYGKPVILSDVLKGYQQSQDFVEAMKISLLTEDDLFFSLKPSSLDRLIQKYRTDAVYRRKLVLFSKILAKSRSFASTYAKLDTVVSGTMDNRSKSSVALLPIPSEAIS